MIHEEEKLYQQDASILTGSTDYEKLHPTDTPVSNRSKDQQKNIERTAENELIQKTAEIIVKNSLKLKKGDKLVIQTSETGWQLASAVANLARSKDIDAQVRLRMLDVRTPKLPLEGLSNKKNYKLPLSARIRGDEKTAENFINSSLEDDILADYKGATHSLVIRDKSTDENFNILERIKNHSSNAQDKATETRTETEIEWCLIYFPNQSEADAAGMTLEEYRRFYFESIANRDWEAVEKAQQKLIEKLSGKNTFHFVSNAPSNYPPSWNTDITMSIKDMVGVNSTIKRNLPGSEVFLAPVVGTLEGTYAIPYPVLFKERTLPNLKLIFKEGKVVDFDLFYEDKNDPRRQDDLDYVRQVLDRDENGDSRGVGELGIGTNPYIRRAFLNTLLVEKAVGIHLALGHSYKNEGFPPGTNVDNGNRSKNHIDIARVNLPEFGGGYFEVDGVVIQKDGIFLDPELDALNH